MDEDFRTNRATSSLIIIYIIIGIVFSLLSIFSSNLQGFEIQYYTVLLSYWIVVGYWLTKISKYGVYLFEPATMVLLLTILMFSIEPLISILSKDTTIAGYEVFDGCIKATLVYVIGATVFIFFYYNDVRFTSKNELRDDPSFVNSDARIENEEKEEFHSKQAIMAVYFFAILGTLIMIISTLQQGYSLQYIFSWGTQGSVLENDTETGIGVLINLKYVTAASYIYLDKYVKNRPACLIFRIIMIFCLLVRTTRWYLIVLLLSPYVYNYVKNIKKIEVRKVLIVVVAVAVLIGVMQFTRGQVRDGSGLSGADWDSFSFLSIWGAFSGNFDLYKTLYGAVTYFPSSHFYTLGQQMIYLTLVTCIPRSIWLGKPSSVIDSELKGYFLGEGAVSGHWAYAQMTEQYVEFGIIGVIVCMGIFAKYCRYLQYLYTQKRNRRNLVTYAVMYPVLMQLVIRGYTPINFWAIVFMHLPIVVVEFLDAH